ncbi:MAG TPA: ABC transporter ATP-binding protein [Candidatus Nanoarchaeia archaeon]|nr:ABC transporter ATP-binding protein [Candidatus Nanoarchaeia archaeon]
MIVRNIEVAYARGRTKLKAVGDINFNVKENEFLCIIGPSGCGKTTLLNTIAGFVKPTKGDVLLNGRKITEPTREIGVVFQHNSLFPWRTIKENITLGPKINGASKSRIREISDYYLNLIGLKRYSNYYPNELSGGMQQRVGFARALANNPEIVLMDEPFSHLDALTRKELYRQLLKILKMHKKTIIFVTHDIDEALILSDRILIMGKRPGKIRKEIENNLPRPRTYSITMEENYLKLKSKLMASLE